MYEYQSGAFELVPESFIKLSIDSIGPAIAAMIIFIVLIYTVAAYFYNRNGSLLPSLITLEFSFFLLLAGYTLYTSSTTVKAVDFWTRFSYMGLSISPFFGISFIKGVTNRSYKKIKLLTIINCFICIALVWFEDKWVITRRVKISPHPTMIKGFGFKLLLLYIMGYLFTCYIIFMWHYKKHPECRTLYWPLAVGFSGWAATGLSGVLHAIGVSVFVDIPWAGPVLMMLATAIYQGKLLSNRTRALENAIKEKDILYEKMIHDDLTGVLNRTYLVHTLGEYIAQESFDSSEHCLLFLDLDNFKEINEACGHQGGDALLRLLGKIIRETCRKTDIPARFGGDEFLVLLRDCNEEQAVNIAKRIQNRYLEESNKAIGKMIDITPGLSIGISSSCHWTRKITDIIDQPDFAMYEAKRAGKNKIGVFQGHGGDEGVDIRAVSVM